MGDVDGDGKDGKKFLYLNTFQFLIWGKLFKNIDIIGFFTNRVMVAISTGNGFE